MEKDQERANFYLNRWDELMSPENRLTRITWYAGGSQENESMVVAHLRALQDAVRTAFPAVMNMLYTNCRNVEGWQNSYVFALKEFDKKYGHTVDKGILAAVAGYLEEGFEASLYVTNGFSPVLTLYGLGLNYFSQPRPPVIAVMAKTPEGYFDCVNTESAICLLRYLAYVDTFWIYVLDNSNEETLMRGLLEQAGVYDFERIRRVRTFSWRPEPFPDKEDVVIWSGRASSMKNPKLGADIFSLLPDVRKEVFIPGAGMHSKGGGLAQIVGRFNKVKSVTVHVEEPPDIYRTLSRSAKAVLITSHAEGFPVGYVELWCQGVIPVIWKWPWNDDLLPTDWPLKFRTPGEAVEMLLEAVKNYATYADILYKWCERRFTDQINMPELVAEVWHQYTLLLGDEIRLVNRRGSYKTR